MCANSLAPFQINSGMSNGFASKKKLVSSLPVTSWNIKKNCNPHTETKTCLIGINQNFDCFSSACNLQKT